MNKAAQDLKGKSMKKTQTLGNDKHHFPSGKWKFWEIES